MKICLVLHSHQQMYKQQHILSDVCAKIARISQTFELKILNTFPPHSFSGVNDKRYSFNKQSESEFTVSISNVNFKDGGNYTCSHYDRHTTEKKVEVTVLGGCNVEATKDMTTRAIT